MIKKIITGILGYPKIVAFQPIAYCTLNCDYCILKDLNFGKKSDKTVMRFDEFKKIIDDISWWCYRIVFSGGEPLLNRELWRMLDYAREKNIETTVATNAQFIKNNVINLTTHPPDKLIVAWEHASKTYKFPVDDIKKIKSLRRKKPEIILRKVLTKQNIDRFHEFYMIAKDVADYTEVKALGLWSEGSEEYFKLMIDKYLLTRDEHPISRYDIIDGKIIYQRKPGQCPAVDKPHVSIKADGSIRPCWYLMRPDPVGNAITQNLSKVWFTYRNLRRTMKYGTKWEACNRCLGIGATSIKGSI